MERQLNILIIEDSQADYLLLQRHLRTHGVNAVCRRVDNTEELEDALSGNNWDLILSDYSIPKLDFCKCFSSIHSRFPELPVILVSGSVGEEQAVELLKMGVTDFILKDRLSRLVPAVQRCLRDMGELSARKSAEKALQESNDRFRMIFDNSIDGIMLTQTDGTILAVNPAACKIFGMTEQEIRRIGKSGLLEVPDERLERMLEQRTSTGFFRGEISMVRRDGSSFPAEISSAVFPDEKGELKTSLIIRDVSERKNLEAQLRHSQKMEDIGSLAGGIAHDFNNILTAIVGYSTLLQMDSHLDETAREYVSNMTALIERASQLTRGLLAFSRKQVMIQRLFNLNDIIVMMVKLINRLIGENITVETHLSLEPLPIMADSGQIEQVLMNLATNARDAMPHGGKLVITTGRTCVEQVKWRLPSPCPPGSYALLSVSDSGFGMDQATVARIFEPFFTTKEEGKGTGLGLSILYGIIKQHNGYIEVQWCPNV